MFDGNLNIYVKSASFLLWDFYILNWIKKMNDTNFFNKNKLKKKQFHDFKSVFLIKNPLI